MFAFEQFLQLFWKPAANEPPPINRLDDYGPIDIPDYTNFMEESRDQFIDRWNYLATIQNQPVRLIDNKCALQDFTRHKLIGEGSFGQVFLATNTKTGKIHAMKAVYKKVVVELGQVRNTRTEKMLLQCTNCPFTMRLDYFYKDNSYLYFVMPFVRGGDLFRLLQRNGKMLETSAMFYVGQVILAIEYLHFFNIVYRDLKPENVLLDHTGYIKLTDFGFCKYLVKGRTYTICGTPDYFAPETLRGEGYGKAVDWWAVGVLVFELTAGYAPFKHNVDTRKYQKILAGDFKCPYFLSEDLKHLIVNVLQVNVTKRIGNLKNGVNDFKNHKWFKKLDWNLLVCRQIRPPLVLESSEETDTKHFTDLSYKSLDISSTLEYGKEFDDF